MEGDPLPSCSQLLLGSHRQTPAGVRAHVLEENSLSGKPKIVAIAPNLGHVASRVTPEQGEEQLCSPGSAPYPGVFQEQTQTVHDPALQAGEEDMGRALTPAEDRQGSWQSSPVHIPGQREADGWAFRALAGGISGALAEGTDLAEFPSAWTISVCASPAHWVS